MRARSSIDSLTISPVTAALVKSTGVRSVKDLCDLNDLDLYVVPQMGPSRIAEVKRALAKGGYALSNDGEWTQERLVRANDGKVESPQLVVGQKHGEERLDRLLELTPDQFVHRIRKGAKDRCILPAADFQRLANASQTPMVRAWALRVCLKHGVPWRATFHRRGRSIAPPSFGTVDVDGLEQLGIVIVGSPDVDERKSILYRGWLARLTYESLKEQRAIERPEDAFFAHEVEFLAGGSNDWRVRRRCWSWPRRRWRATRTGSRTSSPRRWSCGGGAASDLSGPT